MNFEIDEKYITSVPVVKSWSVFDNKKDLTEDDLILILKGEDRFTSHSTNDHPEFALLRNKLEELGYIQTQRQWWNGDVVLKEFTLNGYRFNVDDTFYSACAMSNHLSIRKKKQRQHVNK